MEPPRIAKSYHPLEIDALQKEFKCLLELNYGSPDIWDAQIPKHLKHEVQAIALTGKKGYGSKRSLHNFLAIFFRSTCFEYSCGDSCIPKEEKNQKAAVKIDIPGWQAKPVQGNDNRKIQFKALPLEVKEEQKEKILPEKGEEKKPLEPKKNELKPERPEIVLIHHDNIDWEELKSLENELKRESDIKVHIIALKNLRKGILPQKKFLAFDLYRKQFQEDSSQLNEKFSPVKELCHNCVMVALERQNKQSFNQNIHIPNSGFQKNEKFQNKIIFHACPSYVEQPLISKKSLSNLIAKMKEVYQDFASS